MDHGEAVQKMAAERYLLDELTSDEREAFEEHFFDCPECAVDLRVGAAFVDEAKVQLPELVAPLPHPAPGGSQKPKRNWNYWPAWCRPAFAVPAFAALLVVAGYQNLVTYPALRSAADQPRLLPSVPLRGATRGGSRLSVTSDTKHGVALPIILSQPAGSALYSTYSFELFDPQGKLVWSGSSPAPGDSESDNQPLSLVIPGAMLRNGSYTIVVSGIAPQGGRTEIDRYVLDLHLTD